MKKICKMMIVAYIVSFSALELTARQQNAMQQSAHESSILADLFTAEDGSTGKYWSQDKTAILGEEEYIKVVAIDKNLLDKKISQKMKKNKIYLGSFVDKKSEKTFYLYGVIKNPAPVDNGPDADVLTEIAIKMDYGPGE
ncbi:hypothetical protein KBC04_03025 [Candidatus Babeliales bacterium]|nr:hypothetical protein [Candidatus Babeliales bacterium]MBP9843975.1 hypothetical protein [Candidatus Babeliales bacterium]